MNLRAAGLAGVLATIMAASVALPAFADDDMSPARLERIDAKAAVRNLPINRLQAMEIARSKGMVRFEEIDLDDDDEWEIEGWTADGRDMEIDISARDGRITELEIDD